MVEDFPSAEPMELVSCDLSTQRIRKEKISKMAQTTFVGGRSLAVFLAFDRVSANTHALGEKNHILLCPGLLRQTTAVVTKSPLKYGLSVSMVGPPFGELMAQTGVKALDLWGVAKEPTFLVITEQRVEFQDASSSWGSSIDETRALLHDQYPGYDMIITGPAGENTLRIAAAVHGQRQIGDDGLGAVLGSKNLKGILVEGDLTSVPLDLSDDYLINDIFLSERGKASLTANIFSALSSEPYSGVWPGGISPSGFVFLGPNLGIYNKEQILRAGKYCFNQGLSLRFVGASLGVLASLVEKKRVTGYPDARFGSVFLYNLIKGMQNGKGIVHQMTYGVESLVAFRGENAPAVKGEVGLGIHPGGSTGYALTLAVANPVRTIIPSIEFLGLPFNADCKSWNNKGQLVCWAEDYLGGYDTIGIQMRSVVTDAQKRPLASVLRSLSSRAFLKYAFLIPETVGSLLDESGNHISFKDLLILGARTVVLERLFGTREGLTGSDDRLPASLLTPKHPTKFPSTVLSRQKFFRAKGEYYLQRGLLPSGIPSLETLRKLDLEKLVAL
ncbi:MAG: aldehyde ferredoxin oxidoreductase N-terminal domain-containing protein [Candidatus Heimdallarchaeota archaeon]